MVIGFGIFGIIWVILRYLMMRERRKYECSCGMAFDTEEKYRKHRAEIHDDKSVQVKPAKMRRSMKAPVQSRIAFHLSFWPFVLFVSFLAALYIILIGAAVSPAPSGGTFREAVVIFIILAVRSPAMAAPLLSSLIGVLMSIRITSGWDRTARKNASRAAIFGFASIGLYAYLVFGTTGFGG